MGAGSRIENATARNRMMTHPTWHARRMPHAELRFSPNAEHIMAMPAAAKHYWTAADVRALMDAEPCTE